MRKTVDSFRYISGVTRRMIKSWIKLEEPRSIPWTPLSRPISESTVALISSGGMALKTDRSFDQEGERQNPWWGDPTYRAIPKGARSEQIKIYHLHINPQFGEADLNCLLPIDRLTELEASGEIGQAAASHYSFMGYNLQPESLVEEHTPVVIEQLKHEGVNLVILVPA